MKEKIVADSHIRLLSTPWYREKRAAIEAQVRAKYADELAAASGYWQTLAVQAKVARETRRELRKIGSLYCLW